MQSGDLENVLGRTSKMYSDDIENVLTRTSKMYSDDLENAFGSDRRVSCETSWMRRTQDCPVSAGVERPDPRCLAASAVVFEVVVKCLEKAPGNADTVIVVGCRYRKKVYCRMVCAMHKQHTKER
eukprot:2013242-Karenia_brevis.AAC.1